jgi:hypothetical protein
MRFPHLRRRYGRAQDMGKLRLWKLNEVTGYWDYQRTVTPETADEWRRIFQNDEPKATFAVSKNKPIPPALRQNIRASHEQPRPAQGEASLTRADMADFPWRKR